MGVGRGGASLVLTPLKQFVIRARAPATIPPQLHCIIMTIDRRATRHPLFDMWHTATHPDHASTLGAGILRTYN